MYLALEAGAVVSGAGGPHRLALDVLAALPALVHVALMVKVLGFQKKRNEEMRNGRRD